MYPKNKTVKYFLINAVFYSATLAFIIFNFIQNFGYSRKFYNPMIFFVCIIIFFILVLIHTSFLSQIIIWQTRRQVSKKVFLLFICVSILLPMTFGFASYKYIKVIEVKKSEEFRKKYKAEQKVHREEFAKKQAKEEIKQKEPYNPDLNSKNEQTENIPRVMYWLGKVNQHWNLETRRFETDPDGKSGANVSKLEYCKRWYPSTVSFREYKEEISNTWTESGNLGNYTYKTMSYECVQP